MENIRRHFTFSGQTNKGATNSERSSVFHVAVKKDAEHFHVSDDTRPEVALATPSSSPGTEPIPLLLSHYVQCLSKYHSSGTQVRQELSQMLKGTLYQPLGAMCTTKLTHNVFEKRPDLLQLANEIHGLLAGLQEKTPKTEASQQAVLKCMLLLLKLESQYHEMCLQEMQLTVRELAQSCANHSCHDVLQLMASLGLTNQGSPSRSLGNSGVGQFSTTKDKTAPHSQSSHEDLVSIKENGSADVEDTNKLPPKQGSKSIFSLFGRKNSSDDGRNNASSFYVDIKSENHSADCKPSIHGNQSNQQLHVETGNLLSLSVTPPPSSDGHSKSSVPLIPDRLGTIGSKCKASRNSQLASEEELDSVINLLSGCAASNSSSRTSPQMQSIPENKVTSPLLEVPRDHAPHHHSAPPGLPAKTSTGASTPGASGGGPIITHIPITVTRETDTLKLPPRTQHHRRSEGSIDFTNGDFYARNTWPHQTRTSLPNGPLGAPQGLYDPLSQEHQSFPRRYSSDLQARPRGYYGNQLLSYPQWTFPDSKLQNWQTMSSHTSSQASMLATAGSDTMTSSWSGFQDSDDLSDDSSSGEQFFAVGLDLVSALDSKNDSSDDEFERRSFLRDAKDQRPRSLENLLDVKSNYTWPPKQPWARSALVISEAMEASVHDNSHRPLQMQWSDPMSSRNVWGAAGLGPQLQHRAMQDFGPLPH